MISRWFLTSFLTCPVRAQPLSRQCDATVHVHRLTWRTEDDITTTVTWIRDWITLVSVNVCVCITWGVMLLGERAIRKQNERQRSIVALDILPAWGKTENHFVCVLACVGASAMQERQCWYEMLGWTIWRASYFEPTFLPRDVNSDTSFNIFKPVLRMRWAGHVALMGEEGGLIGSWWGNRRERDRWEDLGIDGWIILGWISRRWDVGMWTGLGWPRIGSGGGRLWVR